MQFNGITLTSNLIESTVRGDYSSFDMDFNWFVMLVTCVFSVMCQKEMEKHCHHAWPLCVKKLTGAYQMLPDPGQYPSPFPKVPAIVPLAHPEPIVPSFVDQDVSQMVSLRSCLPYNNYECNGFSKSFNLRTLLKVVGADPGTK